MVPEERSSQGEQVRGLLPMVPRSFEEPRMNIARHEYPLTEGPRIISRVVECQDTVRVCGTTPDPVGDPGS